MIEVVKGISMKVIVVLDLGYKAIELFFVSMLKHGIHKERVRIHDLPYQNIYLLIVVGEDVQVRLFDIVNRI